MIDVVKNFLKKKAATMLISTAAVLTAAQMALPPTADVFFGAAVVALVWAATKI